MPKNEYLTLSFLGDDGYQDVTVFLTGEIDEVFNCYSVDEGAPILDERAIEVLEANPTVAYPLVHFVVYKPMNSGSPSELYDYVIQKEQVIRMSYANNITPVVNFPEDAPAFHDADRRGYFNIIIPDFIGGDVSYWGLYSEGAMDNLSTIGMTAAAIATVLAVF